MRVIYPPTLKIVSTCLHILLSAMLVTTNTHRHYRRKKESRQKTSKKKQLTVKQLKHIWYRKGPWADVRRNQPAHTCARADCAQHELEDLSLGTEWSFSIWAQTANRHGPSRWLSHLKASHKCFQLTRARVLPDGRQSRQKIHANRANAMHTD